MSKHEHVIELLAEIVTGLRQSRDPHDRWIGERINRCRYEIERKVDSWTDEREMAGLPSR